MAFGDFSFLVVLRVLLFDMRFFSHIFLNALRVNFELCPVTFPSFLFLAIVGTGGKHSTRRGVFGSFVTGWKTVGLMTQWSPSRVLMLGRRVGLALVATILRLFGLLPGNSSNSCWFLTFSDF